MTRTSYRKIEQHTTKKSNNNNNYSVLKNETGYVNFKKTERRWLLIQKLDMLLVMWWQNELYNDFHKIILVSRLGTAEEEHIK